MKEVKLGNFDKIPEYLPSESHIRLAFQPINFLTHWKRCGFLADFVASFYAFYNPGQKEDKLIYTLSTISNELIENAVKFSMQKTSAEINLRHYSKILLIEVINTIPVELSETFQIFFKSIVDRDITSLYFEILESKTQNDTKSGIGLLMVLKDYPVEMGIHFKELESGNVKVTVRSYIILEEEK